MVGEPVETYPYDVKMATYSTTATQWKPVSP